MRRSITLLLMLGLWLLTACGAGAGDSAAVPPDSADGTPGRPQVIRREAECAFPARMQVGRPATVRFSVFSPGNRPNALPSAAVATEPFEIPERPDLEAWISVSLRVDGQMVSSDADREFQRLSERSNIWVWQITPTAAQPITLQPVVDVEYRNASGQVIERQTNVWTQTYSVEDVVGPSYVNVVLSWLGSSISELITGMIGSLLMAGVVNPTRNFFGQRFGKKSV